MILNLGVSHKQNAHLSVYTSVIHDHDFPKKRVRYSYLFGFLLYALMNPSFEINIVEFLELHNENFSY